MCHVFDAHPRWFTLWEAAERSGRMRTKDWAAGPAFRAESSGQRSDCCWKCSQTCDAWVMCVKAGVTVREMAGGAEEADKLRGKGLPRLTQSSSDTFELWPLTVRGENWLRWSCSSVEILRLQSHRCRKWNMCCTCWTDEQAYQRFHSCLSDRLTKNPPKAESLAVVYVSICTQTETSAQRVTPLVSFRPLHRSFSSWQTQSCDFWKCAAMIFTCKKKDRPHNTKRIKDKR